MSFHWQIKKNSVVIVNTDIQTRHDYELPFEIDEYTPIEEVNRLCEMVEDLPEDIQDELSELRSRLYWISDFSVW